MQKKIFFTLYIIISFAFSINAKEPDYYVDSSFTSITSLDITPYEKAEKYKEFALKYRISKPSLAMSSWLKALKIYEKANDDINMGIVYSGIAEMYSTVGIYDLSISYLTKAYKIYLENKDRISLAWLMIDMGNTYYYINNFEKAKKYYSDALIEFTNNQVLLGMSVVFLNYGLINEKENKLDSALYYYNKSLEIRKKLKNPYLIAHIYHYIARIHIEKNNFNIAAKILLKSNELLLSLPPDFDIYLLQLYSNYTLMAKSFEKQNLLNDTKLYIDSALYIANKNTDTLSIINSYIYKAEILIKQESFDEALNEYEKAINYSINEENTEQKADILLNISLLYLQKGDKDKTYQSIISHKNAHSDLTAINQQRKEQAILLEIESKLQEIEIDLIKQKTKDRNRLIIVITLALISALIITLFAFIIKNRILKNNRALINTAFDGIIIHQKGKIYDINHSFINFSGYTHKELKNKNLYNYLFTNIENIGFHNHDNKNFYQTKIKLKNGSFANIEAESQPVRYYGKNLTLITIRDISERIKANAQIHLFKTIIEQNFSTIVITDIKGNIEYVNNSFTKMSGYTAEEVMGKNPRILKSDFHNEAFYKEMWSKISSGNNWSGVFKNIHKNGQHFWEEAYITPIKDTEGSIIKYVAIKQDITLKRELEKEVELFGEKLKRIFEAIDAFVFVVNFASENIITANLKASSTFGKSEGKTLKELFWNKTNGDNFAYPKEKLIQESKKLPSERQLIKSEIYLDNKDTWYELNMQIIKWVDGSPVILIVAYDISESKNTILKLNELNATKDKFFSIISHDLKNPFQGLMGFSEMLLQSNEINNPEMVKTIASHIYNTSKGSFKLLENLLEWANLQKGITIVKKENVLLTSLIEEALEINNAVAALKRISITSNVPLNLKVKTDTHIFNTVFRNLISNSIKFTPSGGQIQIGVIERENDILVSIKDNGMGIPKEMIPKLFRIDTKYSILGTEGEKGNGLGLILCHELIKINGGEIFVESSFGAGSTFFFTVAKSSK